jgi:indole-3-glycerol phosphate synthase
MSLPYARTDSVLDKILANTAEEVAARQEIRPLASVIAAAAEADPPRDMLAALRPAGLRREGRVSLIAEVKHASPSKGVLIEPFDPVALGRTYAASGAAAVSVLTDSRFFQGHLDHLRAVRAAVALPVLRKDFVIAPYQVYEGRAAGADAILLIAAALSDSQLADLHALACSLGIAALVEVHQADELERALAVGPRLLGINNRNLKTFRVSLETTAQLAPLVPSGVTLVAESGILTGEDVRRMGALGAHAVLVGEALLRAADIGAKVRELSGP